jgi:hypothetical protein
LLALLAASTGQRSSSIRRFPSHSLIRSARISSQLYLAVRTQEEWIKFWERGSLEPTLAGDPPLATTAPRPPPPKIDFTRFILLIAESGVKPSSGYMTTFESVRTVPAPSDKMVKTVHIIEVTPGNCPRMTQLTSSVSYALIPQTTNEIRFIISRADSNCAIPIGAPFIK